MEMIKKGEEIFDSELYNDVLAIRSEIKMTKGNIENIGNIIKICKSSLFEYARIVTALEHILLLDKYKEMNESIENDEKYEKEWSEQNES